MGTRRGNRPVSITVAGALSTLGAGHPGVRSAAPCARDPPSPVRRDLPPIPAAACGPAAANPPEEDLLAPRVKKKGEAIATSPLPKRRTRKS